MTEIINTADEVMANFDGLFWTDYEEMLEEVRTFNYTILESNDEYIVVTDDESDDDDEFILRFSKVGSTYYIESVD